MASKLDKYRDKVSADLQPGETLLGVVKVTPRGTVEQGIWNAAGGMAAGFVGIVAGQKMGEPKRAAGEDERAAAGIDIGSASQVLAGVTELRLLIWKLSALGGKPKELLASVELKDIASMTLGEGKLMGQTMPEISCTTVGGSEFGLRVAKVHKSDAQSMIAAARR